MDNEQRIKREIVSEVINVNKAAIARFWPMRSDLVWRGRIKKLVNNIRTLQAVNTGAKRIA